MSSMRSSRDGLESGQSGGGSGVVFADRRDAGRRLAGKLKSLRGRNVVVLGLPRGGVPVAFEVAKELGAPLDVLVVRKLGVPYQPEVAMGAIAEGGFEYLDRDLIARAGVSPEQLDAVRIRERKELIERLAKFRRGRPSINLTGRIAVIVDDGLATGATASVACEAARHLGAARVILAVPVVAPGSLNRIGADEVVFVSAPEQFMAVGYHYFDFAPTTDEEVVQLLSLASSDIDPVVDVDSMIPSDGVVLQGNLFLPPQPQGIVVFAHGSGSSRLSDRNRYVASVLNQAGLGTLLMDLLTPSEEGDRTKVFDIELLARRLSGAVRWLRQRPDMANISIGLFGASTGAGAALWAAADSELDIAAVVSRGGRPDLAAQRLSRVTAPTLLIVGGEDDYVLELNRHAAAMLRCINQVSVVPGATHLFEEPGTLAQAAVLAKDWFIKYLASNPSESERQGMW